jgi:hypothetical protein
LALLEAVQHQFHAAGNSQLFENSEQVISHDLLLARGCTARQVAFVCYVITGSLVIAGWFILPLEPRQALISSLLIGCVLFALEVRMGAMRSRETLQRDLTEEDLRWRETANQALRERI